MSTEQNKDTLRRLHVEELFNKGNLKVADEIISLDYVYHGPAGEFKGPAGVKQIVTMWRTAFPDGRYVIEDMVAEGDKVAVRYAWTGTFTGELAGTPPTGKKVNNMKEVIFYRFAGGKEVEAINYIDMQELSLQLGVLFPPG
jgi:steroid delta-isomerase-like uncharacterized protein